MPIFYMLSDAQKQNVIQDYVDRHEFIDKHHGSIPIKEEYNNQLGRAYKELQQGKTFGGKPYYKSSNRALRNADIKAAERMYMAGYSRKAIANIVSKNSPMTKDMSLAQRLDYKQRLNRAMNKMEKVRKEIALEKKQHGIKTNRIKDINGYAKCTKVQKHAQSLGIKSKPPTFDAYVKNPQLGDRYKQNTTQQIKKQQQQQERKKQEQQQRVKQRIEQAKQRTQQAQQKPRQPRR